MADEPQADRDSADDADLAESSDLSAGAESPLEIEGEIAADYLEELLDIADLDGDIDTYIEGDRAHVSIVSDSHILVGADGEVLYALQELTRLAVYRETGERSRLMLDISGCLGAREDNVSSRPGTPERREQVAGHLDRVSRDRARSASGGRLYLRG